MAFNRFASGLGTALLFASVAFSPATAAEGRKKALLEGGAIGLAAGVVGGVILDRTVLNPGQPAAVPKQAQDPDATYSTPRPVRAAPDPYIPRMSGLKTRCDDGDTRARIRFGVIIGQHKEREAQWRRQHPDMFEYERN